MVHATVRHGMGVEDTIRRRDNMAESTSSGEVLRTQREMTSKRGYGWPEWEWLARKDPAFEKARLNFSAQVFTPENPALPVKYRELIEAVILAFRGYPTVGDHLRRALREGATMQEAIEAFEVATIPGGMPVLHFALPYLIEAERELSA